MIPRGIVIIEIDGEQINWPLCAIPMCGSGVCFDVGDAELCFPHSAEYLNIKPHFYYDLDKLIPLQ